MDKNFENIHSTNVEGFPVFLKPENYETIIKKCISDLMCDLADLENNADKHRALSSEMPNQFIPFVPPFQTYFLGTALLLSTNDGCTISNLVLSNTDYSVFNYISMQSEVNLNYLYLKYSLSPWNWDRGFLKVYFSELNDLNISNVLYEILLRYHFIQIDILLDINITNRQNLYNQANLLKKMLLLLKFLILINPGLKYSKVILTSIEKYIPLSIADISDSFEHVL